MEQQYHPSDMVVVRLLTLVTHLAILDLSNTTSLRRCLKVAPYTSRYSTEGGV